jgi:CheY-like chemotaxis protein
VDRLSRLLGHTVGFRSREGKGTVFSIAVPRSAPPRETDAAAKAANCSGDFRGWRLLVVDDDTEVLESLNAFLGQLGAIVITAASAAEAHRAATAAKGGIDAILSDYRLPDGDGVSVIERIRRDSGRHVPAVVITGETTTESLQRVRDRELMLLHKPVSAEALRLALVGLRNLDSDG